ncbi:MAG: hypothetical protein IK120_06675 [Muribaculaceae bacterium]|nr:hypothetical protein [Muribaculaceae bacterium]
MTKFATRENRRFSVTYCKTFPAKRLSENLQNSIEWAESEGNVPYSARCACSSFVAICPCYMMGLLFFLTFRVMQDLQT